MKHITFTLMALALLSVAACGNTRTERGLSGAGIGAGAGVVGSALTGGSIGGGALVGGLAGGAIGALTDKDDINLD